MTRILLPYDGSASADCGVKHAIKLFRQGQALEVHVLNVQPPFSQYLAQHVSREASDGYHREQAEAVLAQARQALEADGVPCTLHFEVGESAQCIADAAARLRCDCIVMGTARKSSLVRMIEGSVTNRVVERTSVPVEVIAGPSPSPLERIGIPAGVGGGLTALWFAAAE